MGRRRVSRSALLDTSALINAVDARAVASLPFERLFIASLTYAELRLGLATATDLTVLRQRMQRVDDITRLFGPGLPFDDACALEYQRIVERAVGGGQRPRTNVVDRMIAAVASAHSMPLITSNAAAFRGFTDLVEVVEL